MFLRHHSLKRRNVHGKLQEAICLKQLGLSEIISGTLSVIDKYR